MIKRCKSTWRDKIDKNMHIYYAAKRSLDPELQLNLFYLLGEIPIGQWTMIGLVIPNSKESQGIEHAK